MINQISFCGQIKFPLQTNPIKRNFEIKDTFERTQTPLSKSIEESKAKIVDVIKKRNNEYCVTIAPDGTICHENEGDNKHCTFNPKCIVSNAVLIHGYPIALPLSGGDVAVLLASDAKSQEAITKDGKYSRLTKKFPSVDSRGYYNLYAGFEKQLCEAVLDKMGIDYTFTKADLMDMFKDHLAYQTGKKKENITDEEALSYSDHFGLSFDDKDLESSYNKLKQIMMFQLLSTPNKYDKAHNMIMGNYDSIQKYLDTPEGIKLRHKFLIQLAKDYNLTYETNMEY